MPAKIFFYTRRELMILLMSFPVLVVAERELSPVQLGTDTPDEVPFVPPPAWPIWRVRATRGWPSEDAITILASTAWMENRGGGKLGMQSVMNVVMNRADSPGWWGNTVTSVCLFPYQFSCWNPGSGQIVLNMEAMQDGDVNWELAAAMAALAIAGNLPDITGNADSYYDVHRPRVPKWVKGAVYTRTVHGQRFYRVYLHRYKHF
jgi:hypothetical protein